CTASQFHWWCNHQFQYAPEGGIISLWAIRPQFHRPHLRTTKRETNRLLEQSVKLLALLAVKLVAAPPLKLLPAAILKLPSPARRQHYFTGRTGGRQR
ncbi:MAG: hypothetical protein IJ943_03220, partial [Akkermansia sp.]|nr:hypothetical protein [Akkermansia sp.]